MVLYAAGLEPLGFVVATLLFLVAGFLLTGERRFKILLLASVPVVLVFCVDDASLRYLFGLRFSLELTMFDAMFIGLSTAFELQNLGVCSLRLLGRHSDRYAAGIRGRSQRSL